MPLPPANSKAFTYWAGALITPTRPTSLVITSALALSDQFGDKWDDITSALTSGAQLSTDDARKPFYETANNAIRQHVPMIPVAHGGSATVQGRCGRRTRQPARQRELLGDVTGADTFVWMQNAEPISLFCADEEDGESLRGCEQVVESLLAYKIGGTAVVPSLAESYEPNADLTEWTFQLRPGVKFHDGSDFDAKDVIASWAVQWDAANPLHKGRTGTFTYFNALFGAFLNAPQQ